MLIEILAVDEDNDLARAIPGGGRKPVGADMKKPRQTVRRAGA